MPYTMAFHTAFTEPQNFSAEIGVRHERSSTYVPTGRMEAMTEAALADACTATNPRTPTKTEVMELYRKIW